MNREFLRKICNFSGFFCVAFCFAPFVMAQDKCLDNEEVEALTKQADAENPWNRFYSLLISEKGPRSIDQLMGQMADHLDYWTAVYESESAQADYTTPEEPRIISFGKNGKLILTYASCPKSQNEAYSSQETLEVMYFNDQTETFSLREVKFPGANAEPELKPKISEENPQKCIHCHGNPVKPIWHPYNFWPGVFGSISRRGDQVAAKNSPEDRYYQKFKSNLSNPKMCERYRSLHLREDEKDKSYFDYWELEPIKLARCGDSPNDTLTVILSSLNTRRANREVISHSLFEKFQYALAGTICHRFDGFKTNSEWADKFFPKKIVAEYPSIDAIEKEIVQKAISDDRTEFRKLYSTNDLSSLCDKKKVMQPTLCPLATIGEPYFINPQTLARLQYIYQQMGLNVKDWGTSKFHRYSFVHPNMNTIDIQEGLTLMPKLGNYDFDEKACNELAEKSKEALNFILKE